MKGRSDWHTIKKYFRFTKNEIKSLSILILVFAFIFSFNEWGEDKFDFVVGMGNFFVAILVVGIVVLVHDSGQKLAALKVGFRAETQIWWYGLIFALILCFISGGKIIFFAATGMWLHHMAIHRLGHFRYGPNVQAMGVIALMGPVANIVVATFVKFLQVNLHIIPMNSVFVDKFFFFSLLFAVLNLLPIPPLDGSRLLFYSRLTYAFVFGTIAGYLILFSFGIYSYILALICGGAVWLAFYIFFEKEWTG